TKSVLETSVGCLMCPRLERTASDFERVMLISPGAAGGLAGAGGAARRSGALKCSWNNRRGPARGAQAGYAVERRLNVTTGVVGADARRRCDTAASPSYFLILDWKFRVVRLCRRTRQ